MTPKNSTAARQLLAQRLQSADCPVDLTGTDWHTAGELVYTPVPQGAGDFTSVAEEHSSQNPQ